jgi:hypothetical protein
MECSPGFDDIGLGWRHIEIHNVLCVEQSTFGSCPSTVFASDHSSVHVAGANVDSIFFSPLHVTKPAYISTYVRVGSNLSPVQPVFLHPPYFTDAVVTVTKGSNC